MKFIFITFLILGSLYFFFCKKKYKKDKPECPRVVALEMHLEQLEEMEERIKNAQLKLDQLWFDPSQKQELQKTFVGSIRMNINLGKQFLSKGSKDYGDWINSRRVMLDCSQWEENSAARQNGRSSSITMLKEFLFAEIKSIKHWSMSKRNKLVPNTLSDRQAIP